MTAINVDRENMNRRLGEQVALIDSVEQALGRMPGAIDGGVASAIIAFVASAGAEAAGMVADSHRALAAITVSVLDDMAITEEQAEHQLDQLQTELDDQ